MDEQKKTSGSLALNGAPQVITIPPSDPVRDRKLRVAAYARVSSGSEDQLNSFAAQNAHYTELITDNPEWEFVDVYADKGITGTSAEKRDDFQRLLADCRRGRVDKILVKSSSRFARNAKVCNPEEFYWLTEEELGLIQSKLTKLPFEITNWLCGMRITLYSNEPDNMVAVMDCGDWELHGDGELQMLYGAASEASYASLMSVLEGIGEAI